MKFVYRIIALLLIAGCQKGEVKAPITVPCAAVSSRQVIGVNGPTASIVGQPVNFNINWEAVNGCDNFVKFTQDTLSNTVLVKVFAAHDSCSVCSAAAAGFKTSTYTFIPRKPGNWYFKFLHVGKDTLAAVTDTLTVE